MHMVIGDLAKEGITVSPSTKCEDVYSIFETHTTIEGIVVVLKEKPIGLVMRTHFFQKLSTKYGFDLFMKRNIDLVMTKDLLTVDYSTSVTDVSTLAMNRIQESLYDLVIVTKQDRMYGIVSIRELIMKLSEIQINIARYSNPLSGLPGNNVIEETLQEVLTYKRFSVFYIDINSFKAFNDTFGFSRGDEVIKETATIISDVFFTVENEPSFVGHIGGDDFIATVPHYKYEELCKQIIQRFDQFILPFYSQEELERGYMRVLNRRGILENTPLTGISIAVVQNRHHRITTVRELSEIAAKVKRKCKTYKKSTFICMS
ncbi:GGDEF domain-containing protein [Niallia sp. Krafla_26]|uniref:GGDEF domain-containing protein n=1 Tax=Niallia sp. Krafla_26 TaxID=3064703 RepID=UPI003D18012A